MCSWPFGTWVQHPLDFTLDAFNQQLTCQTVRTVNFNSIDGEGSQQLIVGEMTLEVRCISTFMWLTIKTLKNTSELSVFSNLTPVCVCGHIHTFQLVMQLLNYRLWPDDGARHKTISINKAWTSQGLGSNILILSAALKANTWGRKVHIFSHFHYFLLLCEAERAKIFLITRHSGMLNLKWVQYEVQTIQNVT